MSKLKMVKEKLYETKASLVVLYKNGEIKEYYQNRIKDIKEILQKDKLALKDAIIADKVIGKVAASILTVAGVEAIYADVMSKPAISVLEENKIEFQYHSLTDYVQNNDKTGMCPMENKYKDEKDIYKVYEDMVKDYAYSIKKW